MRRRLFTSAPKFSASIVALISLCLPGVAFAVFTWTYLPVTQRQITMQIGTAVGGTIDNVVFNVPGASVPLATPVTSANTVQVIITISKPVTANPATPQTLTVNSSAGLVCQSGGCGSTIIPMNTISWVSTVLETGTYAGWDVRSGSFTGSATQTLMSQLVNPLFQGPMTITNTLTFTYSNATIYPSGVYSGRVVFTASSL